MHWFRVFLDYVVLHRQNKRNNDSPLKEYFPNADFCNAALIYEQDNDGEDRAAHCYNAKGHTSQHVTTIEGEVFRWIDPMG